MTPSSSSLTPPPTTTPSGLSRSTATYFCSSSLPPSSLPSWSLDHSCTTFGIAALQRQAQHNNNNNSIIHRSSTRLIDDDPDRDEEDHIRGIKRNRSQTTIGGRPSTKRRCYHPMMIFLQNLETTLMTKSTSTASTSTSRNNSTKSESALRDRDRSQNNNNNYKNDEESQKNEFSYSEFSEFGKNPLEEPPKFRRRSTIRDPFDLATSIDECKDFL